MKAYAIIKRGGKKKDIVRHIHLIKPSKKSKHVLNFIKLKGGINK
jgi:hypothetical protein